MNGEQGIPLGLTVIGCRLSAIVAVWDTIGMAYNNNQGENMRIGSGVLLGASLFLGLASVLGQNKPAEGTRYGVALDLKNYPQNSAKDALASVLKTVEGKKFDYLVAQLADPSFVDDRVHRLYGGRIEEQVDDTRTRFDPSAVKLLQRFQKDGTWQAEKDGAVVQLKGEERRLSFKKVADRWFMENKSK
jgi:hypothetical protein